MTISFPSAQISSIAGLQRSLASQLQAYASTTASGLQIEYDNSVGYSHGEFESMLMKLGEVLEQATNAKIETVAELMQQEDLASLLARMPQSFAKNAEKLVQKIQVGSPDLLQTAGLMTGDNGKVWLNELYDTDPTTQQKLQALLEKIFPIDAEGIYHASYFSSQLSLIIQTARSLQQSNLDLGPFYDLLNHAAESGTPSNMYYLIPLAKRALKRGSSYEEVFDFYEQLLAKTTSAMQTTTLQLASSGGFAQLNLSDYLLLAENMGIFTDASGSPDMLDLRCLLNNSFMWDKELQQELYSDVLNYARQGEDLSGFISTCLQALNIPQVRPDLPFANLLSIGTEPTEPYVITEGDSTALYNGSSGFTHWSTLADGEWPADSLMDNGYFDLSKLPPGVHHVFCIVKHIGMTPCPSLQTIVVQARTTTELEESGLSTPATDTSTAPSAFIQDAAQKWANKITQAAAAKLALEKEQELNSKQSESTPAITSHVFQELLDPLESNETKTLLSLWSPLLRAALLSVWKVDDAAEKHEEDQQTESVPGAVTLSADINKAWLQSPSRETPGIAESVEPISQALNERQLEYYQALDGWDLDNRTYVFRLSQAANKAFVNYPEQADEFERMFQILVTQL